MRRYVKSIVFKVAIVYVVVTILNVTLFNMMLWENQTELIMDNAILESQHKGTAVKYLIDRVIQDSLPLSPNVIKELTKEAKGVDIQEYKLFSDGGRLIFSRQKGSAKEEVTAYDQRMVNMALTKKSFEGRLFTHELHEDERAIDLFIPFTYGTGESAVLFTTIYMKDIDENMGLLYWQCVVISLLIILIHIAFAAVIAKMLLVPLQRMIVATKEISKGNFKTRIAVSGTDELGMLAASFNEMSTAIAHMQDEAKGANPLTGLPGNITISSRIDMNISMGKKFAVLYCDLDNFKAYNDKYGFIKGDEAILYSRDKLVEASESEGMHNMFVGHEGGDDFVVITPAECWEAFAKRFVTAFDKDIGQFYNAPDRKHGYISSVNRQGQPQQFPLMSMSIAVVTNLKRDFKHHAEIVHVAAEVKKYAKKMEGSGYKVDERSGK